MSKKMSKKTKERIQIEIGDNLGCLIAFGLIFLGVVILLTK